MSNLTPGCLACLMDSDGGFGDCIDASAAVCVAADEDATNALFLRVLSGENIEQSDLMAALSSGCSLAVMTDGGPAAFTCAMPCGARGPPLPPLTTCDEFTAAMATGGCAETCGGASGAYSAEVLQAATDIACPAFMTVVSASAPVTVSDDQAALLVRRTQAFPLVICQWEPQVLAHTALIVWQANTESDEYRSFRSDFEDGVAGTMDGARSKACHRSVMSFSD